MKGRTKTQISVGTDTSNQKNYLKPSGMHEPQYPDNHPLLRMAHIRNRCHRLAIIRSVTPAAPPRSHKEHQNSSWIHLTHFVLDTGGNVERSGAEPHQQYAIISGGQLPPILAISVTDGGKCGFSQLIFPSFRFVFLVSPSVRVTVPFTSHSTSEVQLYFATDRASQHVTHTCHGAYSDVTLT